MVKIFRGQSRFVQTLLARVVLLVHRARRDELANERRLVEDGWEVDTVVKPRKQLRTMNDRSYCMRGRLTYIRSTAIPAETTRCMKVKKK